MKTFSFSEQDLVLASGNVRESLLSVLPSPSDCSHIFSESFEETMAPVLKKSSKAQKKRSFPRSIAAVFLALLVGTSMLLAFSPKTRASLAQWIREIYQNRIIYHYTGDQIDTPITGCEIGWVPDDFSNPEIYQDESMFSAMYFSERRVALVIDYYYMFDGTALDIQFDDAANIKEEPVSVNGLPGTLYLCSDGSESSTLVWHDDENRIEYTINGFLEESEFLRIAESIRRIDS